MVKVGSDAGGGGDTDHRSDASDRAADTGHDAEGHRVNDQTTDTGERSVTVTDTKGRPLATTEGSMRGDTYEVSRADAKHGPEGDAAVSKLADDLKSKGHTVDASKVAPTDAESTRRGIGPELADATKASDAPDAVKTADDVKSPDATDHARFDEVDPSARPEFGPGLDEATIKRDAVPNRPNDTVEPLQRGEIAGGMEFRNRGEPLPPTDSAGNKITYTEFDCDRYNGTRRGAERIIEGSDGRSYTWDHSDEFRRYR